MTEPSSPIPAEVVAMPNAATETIPAVVERLRATFASGRTRSVTWRRSQLAALERLLAEHEKDFAAALAKDLGRSATDAWLADLAPVAAEARHARKNVEKWMRPKRVGVPLSAMPARAWYEYEPLGVTLIIGPWNYPVFLALSPLVGSLAAGNCAIVKPSEHTPTVSAVLAELLPQYLDADAIAVVEGAADETQALLAQGLDHAFFTGGPEIGKAVMTAAAAHLTPVTLELGGKSPAIVTANANIRSAARRVAWTKMLNSGQTCVAPDYVLVESSVRDEFLAQLQKALDTFLKDSPKLLPLVHSRHAGRIEQLLKKSGGRIVRGGNVDVDGAAAELSVVLDPALNSSLMTEEIFGPILPVVTIDSFDAAISHVQRGPKPLAVYLFTDNRKEQRRVLDEVSNGGTVINHLMFQVLVQELPFGGVGNSGMGTYHGKWGFETFSHRKSVVRKATWPDPDALYPPYTLFKKWLLRRVF
ncbi:aldehyde dehydrogenase family protein [Hoyosella subflava]|uniref:Aldehyde dehydrogenase n=1 Tax=Hoyosella subflava (strain DSM 45089 / JCM 17490 / NBRC 109087 / DQS3-9A1) TaxID=443218 RepID=F6ER27_HOYSD|nr:aldehyde dehydrogenase family protein [Hoyosella subflava]AEF40714.1 Aldehyde Dehydrogenase [Hoyosella subflava DQS3-9A1]